MLSIFAWLCIIFILIVIKYTIFQPFEDAKVYKMYEARDNVALAAIEGKISQYSEEYQFVINTINFEIYYIHHNYNFAILIRNMFKNPEDIREYFNKMYRLIEQCEVLHKSYNLSTSQFEKSIRWRLRFFINFLIRPFYYLLIILIGILTIVEKISKFGKRMIDALKVKVAVIRSINSDYSNYYKRQF